MALLRFANARDVFETFPSAHKNITTAPRDQPPIDYLRELTKGETPDDALAFCAYLLPRREAVWWASQCVRALLSEPTKPPFTPPRNGCASRQKQTVVASWRPGLPPTGAVPAPGLRWLQAGPAARWWSATTAALRRRRN